MFNWNPQGDYPKADATSYIDPTAVLVGKVEIGKRVLVGPGAVLRADEAGSLIVIGDDCNVQDRVIVHALRGSAVLVQKGTSLSHGCIVHGPCKIGKNCFIGFGSVVFNANLENGVVVKHLAVVENAKITANRLIPSGFICKSQNETKILKEVDKSTKKFCANVVKVNLGLLRGYMHSSKRSKKK